MAERDDTKRPVFKLSVKNFSVIKEAELEFGKITVLIGPQASGKSLLCRLAFFFSQYLPELANNIASRRPPFIDISRALETRFADWFPPTAWSNNKSEIFYSNKEFSVSVLIGSLERTPKFLFSPQYTDAYERWKATRDSGDEVSSTIALFAGPFSMPGSLYIPSGRAFFSTPNKGFVSVSGKNLDWITQRFSTEMDFDYRAMIASSNGQGELLNAFGKQAEDILHGRIVFSDGTPRFQLRNDARILPFDLLSSGTLELLPLLNPLAKLISNTKYSDFFKESDASRGQIFIEEPESGVFPKTQYALTKLIAWLANPSVFNQSFVITTHSPYILSAFNNLIEAGQAARNNPQLQSEIAKIIPEQYWIKEGDFKAYSIHDGKLESILNESGFIEGNYLDQVSEIIGNEFDELLRLEYEHTKAS